MFDHKFELYPHQQKVMERLTSAHMPESLKQAATFAQNQKDVLDKMFKNDPVLEDAFNLILDVKPNSGKALADFLNSADGNVSIRRMMPEETWDATDPEQAKDFFSRSVKGSFLDEAHQEVNSNFELPDRLSIPSRKGFDGNLSFDDFYYQPKPELDLAECIKKTIPVPVVQLLLEGNSILEDFHEERNEGQTFADHMYCSDSIQGMIDELDGLNIKEFKTKVGDDAAVYEQAEVAMQLQSEEDRRRYAKAVRKRTKQKAKRR